MENKTLKNREVIFVFKRILLYGIIKVYEFINLRTVFKLRGGHKHHQLTNFEIEIT